MSCDVERFQLFNQSSHQMRFENQAPTFMQLMMHKEWRKMKMTCYETSEIGAGIEQSTSGQFYGREQSTPGRVKETNATSPKKNIRTRTSIYLMISATKGRNIVRQNNIRYLNKFYLINSFYTMISCLSVKWKNRCGAKIEFFPFYIFLE
ncbi:unnamed protein product [Rotaria magnacalcarata]|uniref:Uncharacterized protein n=1 Tax=Rotaria magnacalcarata TaxID=392030 RepID=A0A816MGC0_9BILA|nr:unnamed protein product [Rotaria magnacalcarata]CAF5189295.1 unnamed protein product [Rotaria magnacalcarata]